MNKKITLSAFVCLVFGAYKANYPMQQEKPITTQNTQHIAPLTQEQLATIRYSRQLFEQLQHIQECFNEVKPTVDTSYGQHIDLRSTKIAHILTAISAQQFTCPAQILDYASRKIAKLGKLLWPLIDKDVLSKNNRFCVTPLVEKFLKHFNYVITVYNANADIAAIYLSGSRTPFSHAYMKNSEKSIAYLPLPEVSGQGPYRLDIDVQTPNNSRLIRYTWLIPGFSLYDLELQVLEYGKDEDHIVLVQHVYEDGRLLCYYREDSGRAPIFMGSKKLKTS